MRKKKYLLIFAELALLAVAPSISFTNSYFSPTLSDTLKKLGYKTLFDAKNPSFDKWVTQYSSFKEELLKHGIVKSNVFSEAEGAFLFKHWCNASLDSKNSSLLGKAKKYCTMNLEMFALDNPDVKIINYLESNASGVDVWKNAFENNSKKIMKLPVFKKNAGNSIEQKIERFKIWCQKKGKSPYIPKNFKNLKHFASLCVIKKR